MTSFMLLTVSSLPSYKCNDEKRSKSSMRNLLYSIPVTLTTWAFHRLSLRVWHMKVSCGRNVKEWSNNQIYREICKPSSFWWCCELGLKYLGGCELPCSLVGIQPIRSLLTLPVAQTDVMNWSKKHTAPLTEWEYILICFFLLVLGSSQ